MTDHALLKLMLHHIIEFGGSESADLKVQRLTIILGEMDERENRKTPYQTTIQVDQVIHLSVGQCGQGEDKRLVQSGFDVKRGDQLFVYRKGV